VSILFSDFTWQSKTASLVKTTGVTTLVALEHIANKTGTT